jgi:hypothetical protein
MQLKPPNGVRIRSGYLKHYHCYVYASRDCECVTCCGLLFATLLVPF